MERTIRAPDQEWLTDREAAKWLNLSRTMFNALVEAGEIPPAMELGPRCTRWHWMDVVAYAHLRMRKSPKK